MATTTQDLIHVKLKNEANSRFLSSTSDLPKIFWEESNNEVIVFEASEGKITRYPYLPRDGSGNKISIPRSHSLRRENVVSVKFSFDDKFIGVLCSDKPASLEFLHTEKNISFVQKSKRGNILGFFWTFSDNLLIITQGGIELYQFPLQPSKKELKMIKEQRFDANWFTYSAKYRLILISTGTPTNNIQGFHFTLNAVTKIPRFTVETQDKSPIKKNEILISHIYNKLFCIHIHSKKQEIVLYQLTKEAVCVRYRINLHIRGAVSVQVVDNVLVVHNLDSRVSMLFDIRDKDLSFPVAAPLPIGIVSADNVSSDEIEIYSPQWEYHQPNLILDTKRGCIWEIEMNLEALVLSFADRKKLVYFLQKRSNSKSLLLKVLKSIIDDCEAVQILADIFDLLNEVLSSVQSGGRSSTRPTDSILNTTTSSSNNNSNGNNNLNERSSTISTTDEWNPPREVVEEKKDLTNHRGFIVIDQSDLYKEVFLLVEDEKETDFKFMVAVLTEYIRSLNYYRLTVEYFLYELLVRFLVKNDRYYQLHQLLQYHVVTDSYHVACQLLSLKQAYPPALQLALDMFKRLKNYQEIVEVLLTEKQIIPALRFLKSNKEVNFPSAAERFLEVVSNENDKRLFYTVYKFFESRRELKNCQKYTKLFKEMFQPPTQQQQQQQ